jgi:hypothetical protein
VLLGVCARGNSLWDTSGKKTRTKRRRAKRTN